MGIQIWDLLDFVQATSGVWNSILEAMVSSSQERQVFQHVENRKFV